MTQIKTPPPLVKGDTIGIIAPARSVNAAQTSAFQRYMEAAGYRTRESDHLYDRSDRFAASVEARLTDIRQMFTDPEVKAVFAARGGYGSAQLLQGMDWEMIRENTKWLAGFSDITALHAAFGKSMETLHSVMPYSLVMKEPQSGESFRRALDVLEGEQPKYHVGDHMLNVTGSATGRLTGGNLSVLLSLAGTPYEPNYEGSILFLEDLDEYLYHMDRMINNFELRGIFRKIAGLVVGDFSDMHDNVVPFGLQALEIIAERAAKYNLPAMFGFPAGHKKSNFPLIFGRVSTLTVKKGVNSLLM